MENIKLTIDDFRPDPVIGKSRSLNEMFDDAQEHLLRDNLLYDPCVEKPVPQKKVEHVIGSVAVVLVAPRGEIPLDRQNAVPQGMLMPTTTTHTLTNSAG